MPLERELFGDRYQQSLRSPKHDKEMFMRMGTPKEVKMEELGPDDRVGPMKWINRTINIGPELQLPTERQKVNQRKKIGTIETASLARKENLHSLKNVLHKGYWKYRPEHYRGRSTVEDDSGPKKRSPLVNFGKEMNRVLENVKEKTALELKYEHTDRFNFTDEQLARYESVKEEREQKRKERRAEQERLIQLENEKIEAERRAERERIEKEEREYEEMKKKEKERLKALEND